MNARRIILILGALAALLIVAVVTVAVLLHRKMEVEKNQAKTAPARAARAEKRTQTPESKPDDENPSGTESGNEQEVNETV